MTERQAESASELRRRAEEKFCAGESSSTKTLSPEETQTLLHELRVHQIELEMQNEELRRTQHELESSKASYFDLYEMAPVGYLTVNDQGVIQKANLSAVSMFGVVRGALLNKQISKFICPEDQNAYYLQRKKVFEEDSLHVWEMRLLRADGTLFWAKLQARPGRNDECLVIFSDITESKRLEEEKLTLEQQFQQTQKLESLGVLAGGIAHDFNNILTIIICYSELIKQNPEDAAEFIPEIDKAAHRAADLCRQMLVYAGKAQPVPRRVDMVAMVGEMVKMLKVTINQNVVIKLEHSADIPVIKADASQIRQVVMNLIVNASEAIGEAQGEISVSLVRKKIKAKEVGKDHLGKTIPSGEYLCLEVTDSGCGMDDETSRRIFEPFYTTKFTGRGLGMSAVLGIITAHGGALQLFSQLGHGTTFKVFLPIQADDSASRELPLKIAAKPWQGNGTVLLVEDEEQLVFVVTVMLKALGFAVISASNGSEALELYQKDCAEITLVLTDMGMPTMDGYELFRELKKLDPALPIIISSGFGDAVVTSRIPREEIAGLVSKPYSFEQLRKVLRSVLEGGE